MRKILAFTLAEVLITLTIIGVIAALTIPNLMQKYQEQEMISRLKRFDTVISNAWQLALRENGPIEDIGPGNTDTGAEKVFNYIKPYLKVKKYCKNVENCWDKEYKTLNNTAYLNTGKIGVKGHSVGAQLYDGSLIYFWSGNDKCTESSCAAIYVDLNGKKGPNKTGFDTFKFRVWQEGITPYPATLKQGVFTLAQKEVCRYKGTSIQNGDACTYWVIHKGNMDYKYRDVSAEW